MFETIVWATDGSRAADRALPLAQELAEQSHGKLVVIHVKELMVGRAAGYPVFADDENIEARVREQFDALEDAGIDATLELFTEAGSQPAYAIAKVAEGYGADVIVVGTRGHGPVAGLLLGSVTQRLLHIAHCPVLAVPDRDPLDRPKRERKTLAETH
jgi:nucleotide-binding universal stress UspA family protein